MQGSPRRILFVSHVSVLGGAEHSLLDLLHTLDRRQYAPRVVLPAPGELSRHLETMEVPFETCSGLRRLHRSREPLELLAQAGQLVRGGMNLRRLIRRHRPHLLHTNSTTSALYALGLPPGLACPVVWHLRDLALPAWLGRWLARRCARIVVPSRACRDRLCGLTGALDVELIPNGVRIESAGRRRGEPSSPLVVTVGQLAPWKGHALMIEAARHVRRQNPAARFVIIGDDRFGDHPGVFERLERQVRESGLEGCVDLLGYREDVRAILDGADLLVHPAYPEPFGRVVVEAMSAGRPVVAFAGTHGPAEILRHGVDGLLVGPRTPQALAAAVGDLLADPARREKLGTAAKKRAAELYDRSLMARRVEALYTALLSANPPPGEGPGK